MSKPVNKLALATIFLTVILDAAGIGLVLPVMPDLFGGDKAAGHIGMSFGLFLSLYALMQFICAPLLGAWSDRIGRKPVLIISLVGATLNYGAMALLPPLWLLFIARAIAGMSGANMSVASAYLTDISAPEQRAARFGQLSACMGVGFILGPAAGGMLRELGLSWPFAAAAALAAVNLLMCLFVLPESRPAEPAAPEGLDPLAGLKGIGLFKRIAALLMVSGLFCLIGEVGGSVWVLYVGHTFHWTGMTVGLSLTMFGLFHALAQAFVVGPLTKWAGERTALMIGMAADAGSYITLAFMTDGIWVFALVPVLCIGGIGPAILQAVISHKVSEDRQGQLQGVIASLASLAAIIGPTAYLWLYFGTRDSFPGLVWLAGAALYLICVPVLWRKDVYKPVAAAQ